ncbi:copper resistance D family protein [Salibacterium qingdaonense]|uniref:Putative copper resistance protein D n=1 Tax=Salibacterium qingdaonense TaxID=266892 RepID=A0A1I4ILH6_9BACI|nr:hypothetical protein [Salibacterium qingdaonense]SFL55115.1 putative copper resistance protein D [Salibacterium qingdaonense]
MLVVSITEFLLYISFSILIGSLIISLIPENRKPPIYIPKKFLILAASLIPLAAFFPVFQTAKTLAGDMDIQFILTNVLFTFEIGKAWLLLTILSVILIIILSVMGDKNNKNLTITGLILTLFILLAYTRSSHAATITEGQGFVVHTLHFLAVSIWIGILFVVSWFSKNKNNWPHFLQWYTPVAIVCLFITFIAGYFTMQIDINSYDDPNATIFQEYQNALLVNYGQALILKHIFIISLVAFATINGVLFRKKHNHPTFNPLIWAKMESVFGLIVFGLTAFMGQSWPPHQVYSLIKDQGASPLFNVLYDGEIINTIQNSNDINVLNVSLSLGVESIMLFLLGLLFMVLTIIAAARKSALFPSFLSSLLMVLSFYLGIMTGIV